MILPLHWGALLSLRDALFELLAINLVLNLTLCFILLDVRFLFEMAEFFKTTDIFGVNQDLYGLKNIDWLNL